MKDAQRMTARYRLALTLLTGVVLILSVAYLRRTQELKAALQEARKASVEVAYLRDANERRRNEWRGELAVSEARRIQAETALSRRREEAFEQTGLELFARRVTDALRDKDWASLRPLCVPRLALGKVTCVYSSTLTPALQRELLGGESLNAVVDASPESGRGRFMSLTLTLDTHRSLRREERREFEAFCQTVNETPPGWTDVDANSIADDGFPFYGPAIKGKICSNTYWRVEIERRNGEWRVTRMFVTTH